MSYPFLTLDSGLLFGRSGYGGLSSSPAKGIPSLVRLFARFFYFLFSLPRLFVECRSAVF